MRTYSQTLTPGKVRGLRSITKDGRFTIAAMDHRATFSKLYGRQLDDTEVRDIKRSLLSAIGQRPSAVLLDHEVGFGLDDPRCGLIMKLEAGYADTAGFRQTRLLDDWTVAKIKRAGADAVKLIIHIDPRMPASVAAAVELATAVAADCMRFDLPLLLEPIVPDGGDVIGELVLAALSVLADIPADVFKIQYPGEEYIDRVGPLLDVPWTILSAGADFDQFRSALRHACAAGCSGFVAGRSLWRELGQHDLAAYDSFVRTTVPQRFSILCQIVDDTASSLWAKVHFDSDVKPHWYESYFEPSEALS